MNKLLIVILVIAALVVGTISVLVYLNPSSHMEAHIIMTPSPVTLELAKEECPISLPESASNIQYGMRALSQFFEVYVRFEAPVEDCLKHAEKLLNEYSSAYNLKYVSIRKIIIFERLQNPETSDDNFDLSWYDVEVISNGTKCTLEFDPRYKWLSIHTPIIYVDLNRGVFYYEFMINGRY